MLDTCRDDFTHCPIHSSPPGPLPERSCRLPHEPDVVLTLDVLPLLGRTQFGKQPVERRLIGRRVLKPGEEIERLVLREIPAVVKPSRQGREILEPEAGVPGLRFKNVLAFGLGEGPPCRVLSNRDQRGARGLGAPEVLLRGYDLALFVRA